MKRTNVFQMPLRNKGHADRMSMKSMGDTLLLKLSIACNITIQSCGFWARVQAKTALEGVENNA
jgi:hypothetical protein